MYGVPYPRLQVIGSCPHTTYLYLLRYLNRRTGRADLCPWKVGQRAPTASFVNGSRPGLPGASRGEAAGFLHVLQGSSAGCVPPAGLDLAVFGVFSAAPVSVELSPLRIPARRRTAAIQEHYCRGTRRSPGSPTNWPRSLVSFLSKCAVRRTTCPRFHEGGWMGGRPTASDRAITPPCCAAAPRDALNLTPASLAGNGIDATQPTSAHVRQSSPGETCTSCTVSDDGPSLFSPGRLLLAPCPVVT